MTPNRKIDSLDAGELIQQLSARKNTPTRFSIDLPPGKLIEALKSAYISEVRMRRRSFILDDATLLHIESAARWLADPNGRFGLMLTGLYGNGKTTLMAAICSLINWLFDSGTSSCRRSIRIVKARDMAWMAVDREQRPSFEKLFTEELLAIDELGEDPAEIISYGMIHTPIRDLIEERYARQKFTIVATNLLNTPEKPQLAAHYGERVVDRLREMMKIIPFHNPSYRSSAQ